MQWRARAVAGVEIMAELAVLAARRFRPDRILDVLLRIGPAGAAGERGTADCFHHGSRR
jgi:hypothetical protein